MLIHEFLAAYEIPNHISILDNGRDAMLKISDKFILDYHFPIRKVKMNCERICNLIDGLAYHGTTILDVQMAKDLIDELRPYEGDEPDCKSLITFRASAISDSFSLFTLVYRLQIAPSHPTTADA